MIGKCAFAAVAAALSAFGAAAHEDEPPALERRVGAVDWDAARRAAAADGVEVKDADDGAAPNAADIGMTSVGEAARRAAERLRVPILLPRSLLEAGRRGALDQPLSLIARTDDYAAEAKGAGRTYLVQGTRLAFAPAGEAEPASPPGEPSVKRHPYGVEISFQRYGVVYSIAIFCAEPDTDLECAEEIRIRALAAEMTFTP